MSTSQTHFSCGNCNRQFRWKPEIAGRRAKCSCGETVLVPAALPPEPEDDLYQFMEEEAVRVIPIAPPLAAGPATISYQRAEPGHQAERQPIHPLIDIGLPAGLLLLALAFISLQSSLLGRPAFAVMGVWILIGITTVPWIVAFLLYGLINSGRLKIAYVSFLIAAFKILTISVVGDAAFFSVLDYLRWSEGLRVVIYLQIFWIVAQFLIGIGVAMKACSLCLFHRDEDRFKKAGFTVASLTWVLHVMLVFVINSILAGMMARRSSAAAVVTAAAARPPVPSFSMTVAGRPIGLLSDAAILHEAPLGLTVREGRDWKTFRLGKTPELDALVDGLYAQGASRVYLDLRSGITKPTFAYVEFPAIRSAQSGCLEVYQAYRAAVGMPARQIVPSTRRRFTALALR